MKSPKTLANVAFHVAKERYSVGEDKFAPQDPATWKAYQDLETLHPIEVARIKGFAPDQLTTSTGEELEPWVKCDAKPILNEPLRDPHICRGHGGNFILSGTVATMSEAEDAPDFRNSLRILLWQSSDLLTWTSLGVVWDISDSATCRHPDRTANAWSRWARFDGQGVARGITAPKVFFLKGTYWITFSLCESGSAILKSLSGNPEGPYEHAGLAAGAKPALRLTTRSGTPSLFEDKAVDGAVYAIWDEGWIARMRDDLTALGETPRLLQVEPESLMNDYPLTVGLRGAAIVKWDGRYVLTGEEICPRLGGNPCHDTFAAVSDSLFGPYRRRRILVPHGGAAGLFQDESERWNAVYAGHPEDAYALCQNRAAIVPLFWDRGLDIPYRRLWTNTEAGSVARLKPVLDHTVNRPIEIRDPQALVATDGWIYVAGTHRKSADDVAGVRLWRSRDFERWETVPGVGHRGDFVWLASESDWATHEASHPNLAKPESRQWGAQPFEHQGTFYIPFMIWPFHQTGILRSISGKPEGPYEETGFRCKDGAPHLFRDDDGTVWIYFCFGPTRLAPLNEDLSDFVGPLADVTYVDDRQQGYEGSWILKFAGKYLLFQSDWWGEDKLQRAAAQSMAAAVDVTYGYMRYGTYDWMYSVSDHIRGPYGPPRLAVPHGGTCSVVRDEANDRWMASVFCCDSTAPFACSLGFIPLNIREINGEIDVAIATT